MANTPLQASALVAAIVLLFGSVYAPSPKPEKVSKAIIGLVGSGSLVLSIFGIAAYPAGLPVATWTLGLVFLALAVASPLLGLLENRFRSPTIAYSLHRTASHLVTNVLGAGLATASVALARRFPGTSLDSLGFSNDVIFNVFLVVSMVIVIYFVYGQQVGPEVSLHNEDDNGPSDAAEEQRQFEFSMLRWNQISNVLFLITVTFVAITSFLYVLAATMLQARRGTPLEFSWEAAVTIGLALLFTLACGLPGARNDQSVFLTFLTGTPALLVTAILWVSFFNDSFGRNAFAFGSTSAAYAAYVGLVVWDLYDRGEAPQPHFFAALILAALLAVLMVGLYFSI